MSEKIGVQSTTPMYSAYATNRVPQSGASYQGYTTGVSSNNQTPLSNMQNLKTSLPTTNHNSTETGNDSRQGYSNPIMVLPSGQTVPLSSFYSQQNGIADGSAQLPYVQNSVYPGFMAQTAMATGAVPNYNWPYGMASAATSMDTGRRVSWSSDENNASHQIVSPIIPQEYYQQMAYLPMMSASSQHYIVGPIQPMKCGDNKSYEMVNLDELVSQEPAIPRAVPALWTNQEELSLAKCLQNPEGITNVYIRGFMPDTTDEDLEAWASRFGEIESCKAIIEQDTGKCKGFGFVMYYSPAAAENCIRGFFHLGFQASYAQKSRNSRLKDLEDRTSTNIYCTGVPIEWNESDLAKHFLPYHAISTKICRDVPSGVSKEVGFTRFDNREIAERVIRDFHGILIDHDGVKLCLRFADTKAQKQLKQQSQERRNWRSREYSYSVEHTPSPTLTRLQGVANHISPAGSYQSPAGASNNFTPATSVSPPEITGAQKIGNAGTRSSAWPMQGGLQSITNSSTNRNMSLRAYQDGTKTAITVPAIPEAFEANGKATKTPSPKKTGVKADHVSGKDNNSITIPSVH